MSAAEIDAGTGFAAAHRRCGRDIAAARKPARVVLCVAAGDPAVARRLLRDLRSVLDRLYRAGPEPRGIADHDHAGLFRLFRHRRLRGGDLCRIVRRHLLPRLSGRPVWPALDLHLCAAGLYRGLGDDGVPDHVRRACCCGASSPASASASRSSPSTPISPNWCQAGCGAAPLRSTRP